MTFSYSSSSYLFYDLVQNSDNKSHRFLAIHLSHCFCQLSVRVSCLLPPLAALLAPCPPQINNTYSGKSMVLPPNTILSYSSMGSDSCFRPMLLSLSSQVTRIGNLPVVGRTETETLWSKNMGGTWFMDFALYVLFLNACPLPLKKYLLFKCPRRANKWEILNFWETRTGMCQVLYVVLCSFIFVHLIHVIIVNLLCTKSPRILQCLAL